MNFLRFENVSERFVNHITFCLDDDVIDIGLGVAPDLPLEAFLDGLLICSLNQPIHVILKP